MVFMEAMNAMRFLALCLLALLLAGTLSPLAAVPSLTGPTGGLTIPNPMTLEPERTEVALGLTTFDALTSNLDVKTSWDLATRVNVGVYHNLELGFQKTFAQETDFRDPAYFVSGKMRFPVDTFNVAVGVVAPITGPDASSLYTVLGWKALWGGFGVNFGGKKFKELTLNQLITAGISNYGGFNLRRTTIPGRTGTFYTGEADTYFGLLGFDYKVSRNMSILGDYDGDRFAGGFRFRIKELYLDTAYIGQKESDTLFSRQTQNVLVSVAHRF